MSSALIMGGLGIAAVGMAGRYYLRNAVFIRNTVKKTVDAIPGGAFSKYYPGGFEKEMTKREASLILGVSPSASAKRVGDAHKRIMLINHPDRGGSPYLAAKINEAKEFMEKKI